MKARDVSSIIVALAVTACCIALKADRPYLAPFMLLASLMAAISLHGSRILWKPWFMAGVAHDEPSCTIFAVQALAAEAMMVVGILAGTDAPWLVGLRGMLLIHQISTVGKLSKDLDTPTNENSRKLPARPDSRNPRQPGN